LEFPAGRAVSINLAAGLTKLYRDAYNYERTIPAGTCKPGAPDAGAQVTIVYL